MHQELSARSVGAVGLIIAQVSTQYAQLAIEDRELLRAGLDIAWQWVEGKSIDPNEICDYIDGDKDIPIRSLAYAEGTPERDALCAGFLAIGWIAAQACCERGTWATASVENFGENELKCLRRHCDQMKESDQMRVHRIEQYLRTVSPRFAAGDFGRPVIRESLDAT